MEFLSKNIDDTRALAMKFASELEVSETSARVYGLYGELGAGKTTFMKYVAEFFAIKETIQSPTFVIMKKYDIRGTSNEVRKEFEESYPVSRTSYFDFLIHIDAYRIENPNEILNLGWQEIIGDSKNIVFVEWPEKIAEVLPTHKKIIFEHRGENERVIKFE